MAVAFGLLWVSRWYLSWQAGRPRRDEVPFVRQYERIESESGGLRSVQRVRDLLLVVVQYWDKVALLLLAGAVSVSFVTEPVTRWIVGVTVLVMVGIVVVWFRRRAATGDEPPDMPPGISVEPEIH